LAGQLDRRAALDAEINPLRGEAAATGRAPARLARLEAERAEVAAAVTGLEGELGGLRATLAERQAQQALLEARLEAVQGVYATLLQQGKEVAVLRETGLRENRIGVVGDAEPLPEPVAPRKALNLAVAGVLGLFMGVFLVYLLDFWRGGLRDSCPQHEGPPPARVAV